VSTLFLDFGNVVGFFDHQRAVAKMVRFTPLTATELTLSVYGSVVESDYETGRTDTAEFVRLAKANGRLACTDAEFLEAFNDIFTPNPEVCDLIPRLAASHRLVLASNTNPAHFGRFSVQFADVLRHFTKLGVSHEAGARKPHAAFFAYCQQFADAPPAECAFVDDLPANVEAATAFGWQGIVYRPGENLAAKLRAAGMSW
jgi:putative hydrolase of the HAD superfamily